MKLFKDSKLEGRAKAIKLLEGDEQFVPRHREKLFRSERIRVSHNGTALFCITGRPMYVRYGTTGAGTKLPPKEWTRRVNYYLTALGLKKIKLIKAGESGFKDCV